MDVRAHSAKYQTHSINPLFLPSSDFKLENIIKDPILFCFMCNCAIISLDPEVVDLGRGCNSFAMQHQEFSKYWHCQKKTSSQAQSYASLKLCPASHSLTGVTCRATSVAKKGGLLTHAKNSWCHIILKVFVA